MKNNLRKYGCHILTFLLFLLANAFALGSLSRLRQSADLIALCYPEGTVSASVWEQLEKNEQKEILSQAALWKSMGETSVSAEYTGREQKLSCYGIKGQPGAVFGKELLHGRYFLENEDAVCLLDQDSARQLFGTENVLGMELCVNGKSCQITGILGGNRRVCVIPAGKPEGFDSVAVRKNGLAQSSGLTVSLIETVAGSTGGQRIDGHLYYMTAWIFYAGVWALLLVFVGVAAGRQGKRLYQAEKGHTAELYRALQVLCPEAEKRRITITEFHRVLPVLCLAGAVGILLLGVRHGVPGSDYLPTYWSDFEFFSRLFREKAGQIQALAAHQEFSSWQSMFRAWQQVIGAGIFAGAAVIIQISLCTQQRTV